MYIDGWKYYNHAALPTCAPHEEPNKEPLKNRSIWKIDGGKPLLVRWTENFDCEAQTEWWYVIKDSAFDINSIKAKRRYEINKGNKNFKVERIIPQEYSQDLFETQVAAFSAYPKKYRPTVDKEQFLNSIKGWQDNIVYGAFDKIENRLRGYALLSNEGSHINFSVLKTNPEYEHLGINAAIVYKIIQEYNENLGKDLYICDGERPILHETGFQDYLIKYFEFRKAYCNLRVKFRFPVNIAVNILYPFRKLIKNKNKLSGQILGLLKMKEIQLKN